MQNFSMELIWNTQFLAKCWFTKWKTNTRNSRVTAIFPFVFRSNWWRFHWYRFTIRMSTLILFSIVVAFISYSRELTQVLGERVLFKNIWLDFQTLVLCARSIHIPLSVCRSICMCHQFYIFLLRRSRPSSIRLMFSVLNQIWSIHRGIYVKIDNYWRVYQIDADEMNYAILNIRI